MLMQKVLLCTMLVMAASLVGRKALVAQSADGDDRVSYDTHHHLLWTQRTFTPSSPLKPTTSRASSLTLTTTRTMKRYRRLQYRIERLEPRQAPVVPGGILPISISVPAVVVPTHSPTRTPLPPVPMPIRVPTTVGVVDPSAAPSTPTQALNPTDPNIGTIQPPATTTTTASPTTLSSSLQASSRPIPAPPTAVSAAPTQAPSTQPAFPLWNDLLPPATSPTLNSSPSPDVGASIASETPSALSVEPHNETLIPKTNTSNNATSIFPTTIANRNDTTNDDMTNTTAFDLTNNSTIGSTGQNEPVLPLPPSPMQLNESSPNLSLIPSDLPSYIPSIQPSSMPTMSPLPSLVPTSIRTRTPSAMPASKVPTTVWENTFIPDPNDPNYMICRDRFAHTARPPNDHSHNHQHHHQEPIREAPIYHVRVRMGVQIWIVQQQPQFPNEDNDATTRPGETNYKQEIDISRMTTIWQQLLHRLQQSIAWHVLDCNHTTQQHVEDNDRSAKKNDEGGFGRPTQDTEIEKDHNMVSRKRRRRPGVSGGGHLRRRYLLTGVEEVATSMTSSAPQYVVPGVFAVSTIPPDPVFWHQCLSTENDNDEDAEEESAAETDGDDEEDDLFCYKLIPFEDYGGLVVSLRSDGISLIPSIACAVYKTLQNNTIMAELVGSMEGVSKFQIIETDMPANCLIEENEDDDDFSFEGTEIQTASNDDRNRQMLFAIGGILGAIAVLFCVTFTIWMLLLLNQRCSASSNDTSQAEPTWLRNCENDEEEPEDEKDAKEDDHDDATVDSIDSTVSVLSPCISPAAHAAVLRGTHIAANESTSIASQATARPSWQGILQFQEQQYRQQDEYDDFDPQYQRLLLGASPPRYDQESIACFENVEVATAAKAQHVMEDPSPTNSSSEPTASKTLKHKRKKRRRRYRPQQQQRPSPSNASANRGSGGHNAVLSLTWSTVPPPPTPSTNLASFSSSSSGDGGGRSEGTSSTSSSSAGSLSGSSDDSTSIASTPSSAASLWRPPFLTPIVELNASQEVSSQSSVASSSQNSTTATNGGDDEGTGEPTAGMSLPGRASAADSSSNKSSRPPESLLLLLTGPEAEEDSDDGEVSVDSGGNNCDDGAELEGETNGGHKQPPQQVGLLGQDVACKEEVQHINVAVGETANESTTILQVDTAGSEEMIFLPASASSSSSPSYGQEIVDKIYLKNDVVCGASSSDDEADLFYARSEDDFHSVSGSKLEK